MSLFRRDMQQIRSNGQWTNAACIVPICTSCNEANIRYSNLLCHLASVTRNLYRATVYSTWKNKSRTDLQRQKLKRVFDTEFIDL
jgi:hypothetical protein